MFKYLLTVSVFCSSFLFASFDLRPVIEATGLGVASLGLEAASQDEDAVKSEDALEDDLKGVGTL